MPTTSKQIATAPVGMLWGQSMSAPCRIVIRYIVCVGGSLLKLLFFYCPFCSGVCLTDMARFSSFFCALGREGWGASRSLGCKQDKTSGPDSPQLSCCDFLQTYPLSPSPNPTRDCDRQLEEQMEREARVLRGVVEYLLPQVGDHVATLDLAHGTAVSNEVVRSFT